MVIYIMNQNFEIIDCIDQYISLIWTTRYCKRGDFELMVKASKESVQKLQKGLYLVREDDVNGTFRQNVMVVQNIQIQTDVEDGDNFIVSGYDLKDIVHSRVICAQTVFNNSTVKNAVKKLLDENIISASASRRIVTHFNFDNTSSVGSTESMTGQVTGDNLGDYIEELLDKYGYGYRIYVDDGEMYLSLIDGTNRSMEQSTYQYVIFSSSFDNLLSTDYSEDTRDFANVAYVAGEGEGADRKITFVGLASGLARREIWVDARDISSNDGEISADTYTTMLQNRGRENLAEHSVTTLFDGNVNNTVNYKLGVDYFLGDIVQVVTDYGITLPARITEIIESDDINGSMLLPTFEYKGGEQ